MNRTITADDVTVGDTITVDFDAYFGTGGTITATVTEREDVFSGEGPYVWLMLQAPGLEQELILLDTEPVTVTGTE